MKIPVRAMLVGFLIGAFVPVFWGILSFVLFNGPENWFSKAYWGTVYLTCPFWRIDGEKAMILMPLLNGLMYAVIAAMIQIMHQVLSKSDR